MKLYTASLSPNCRRVAATIYQLGLEPEVEFEEVDFSTGFQTKPEFLALNPNGKVPVLVDGDEAHWESNAIMIHLAEKAGDGEFFPADRRIETLRWLFWETAHFNRAIGTITWETIAKRFFGRTDINEAVIEEGIADFRRFAAVLDSHLADRPFLLGQRPTLADFSVGSRAALALHPDSRVPVSDFAHVAKWYGRLDGIPAWARSAPNFATEPA